MKDGVEKSRATTARLEIPKTATTDAGHYTVLVRNRAGSVLSAGTMVTVGNK
jgi:hypothetical protein